MVSKKIDIMETLFDAKIYIYYIVLYIITLKSNYSYRNIRFW